MSAMQVDAHANGDLSPADARKQERDTRLQGIISGKTPILQYLSFLYARNHADLAVLKNAKSAVEARNSVCHSAVIFANAIMHAGTTVDSFLRENLDWLSRATNWAKFGATAGLGVIHRGHLSQVQLPSTCCKSCPSQPVMPSVHGQCEENAAEQNCMLCVILQICRDIIMTGMVCPVTASVKKLLPVAMTATQNANCLTAPSAGPQQLQPHHHQTTNVRIA